MRGTGDPNSDDQQNDADDAELAELVPAEQAQKRYARERQEPETKPDNVSRICHLTVPSIRDIELFWRSDIEEQVSERCLEGIECEVQNIERDDREDDSGVLNLIQTESADKRLGWGETHVFRPLRVPAALSSTKEIDEEGCEILAIRQSEGGQHQRGC